MLTDQQHPITPPPELLQQWATEYWGNPGESIGEGEKYIATQAARWGADQELHALLTWLRVHHYDDLASDLLAARRPKPPSLAEAALEVVTSLRAGKCVHRNGGRMNVLTAALKRLQELEEGNE